MTKHFKAVKKVVPSDVEKTKKMYNPDTTIVTGIVCNACKNELPPMTMTEHLEGKFNKECPHK